MYSIKPLRAFSDNYIWLCVNTDGQALVVDPGDAEPVLAALQAESLELAAILVTHHHFDHTGGVAQLKARYGCPVYGPHNPDVPEIDYPLADADTLQVLGLELEVLTVPGHTLDHIAYFHSGASPFLFCGDTLFAGGCGRVFEGTFPMMHNSLQRLAALPEDTAVYCAHEYTLANLAFAEAAEPDNARLKARVAEAQALRARDEPTVPSTIGLERATNPFLRCTESGIASGLAAHGETPAAVEAERFGQLREWKNEF